MLDRAGATFGSGEIFPVASAAAVAACLEKVMSSADLFVLPAATAAERGLPPIQLRFRVGPALTLLELEPSGSGGALVVGEERGTADRLIGRIEIGLFAASLIIDGAGVVEEIARSAAQQALREPVRSRLLGEGSVELGAGAVGFRADHVMLTDEEGRPRPTCPYTSWIALTSGDPLAAGGALVVVRSAGADWAAAAAVIDSLEIGGVRARQSGAEAGLPGLSLPLVRGR